MKLHVIHEATMGSALRRFMQYVKGEPGFGPGVDPKSWGEVQEIVAANGMPEMDFEGEWNKAMELENNDAEAALKIYKKLADKHPLSGLRSKSYFKRSHDDSHKLFIVIDIDNLKYLNTKLGHQGADSVLRKFGGLLKKYIEVAINKKFGNISKTFHRSGDEFNAIIHLEKVKDKNETPANIIKYIVNQCQILLDRFSGIEFKSEARSARATATVGVGFNEKHVDKRVEEIKKKRREPSLIGKMPHLILDDDVQAIINT